MHLKIKLIKSKKFFIRKYPEEPSYKINKYLIFLFTM